MLEKTRTYKGRSEGRNASAPPVEKTASGEPAGNSPAAAPVAATVNPPASEEPKSKENLDRRAMFAAILPSLGNGLVKILRAGNNLQRDLTNLHEDFSQHNKTHS
jgi:hypothetical protein